MSFIKKEHIKTYKRLLVTLGILLTVFAAGTMKVHAASLSISPASATVTAGESVTVRVTVNSEGKSINAVSGGVTFSNDELTLTKISKGGSIVTLWAQDPAYSNSSGTASFQGVILNGYTGTSGTVLTLTFKAKKEGTATVGISSGSSSVLLNDGQGTNVLDDTNGTTITIGKAATAPTKPQQPVTVPVQTPTQPVQQPTAPIITTTPTITEPTFTEYQTPLLSGNYIVAKGTGAPNTTFIITLTHTLSNGTVTVMQASVTTNADGNFTYVSDDKVSSGKYSLTITTADGKTLVPVSIVVKSPFLFVILTWITAILSVKIPLFFALLIIILITWYFWRQNRILKKYLRQALKK